MSYWQGTRCNFQSLTLQRTCQCSHPKLLWENHCEQPADCPIQCRFGGVAQGTCLNLDRLCLFIDYISRNAPGQRFDLTFLRDPDNSAWKSWGCVIKFYCKAQHLSCSLSWTIIVILTHFVLQHCGRRWAKSVQVLVHNLWGSDLAFTLSVKQRCRSHFSPYLSTNLGKFICHP